MPYKITKNKDGTYRVSSPNRVHAESTTKENAERQVRLMNAVEHGYDPHQKYEPPKKKKK